LVSLCDVSSSLERESDWRKKRNWKKKMMRN
jgi:hypothetical protein